MKRKYIEMLAVVLLAGIWVFVLYGLYNHFFADRVLASLPKYESEEFYTSGGFQDYTDYAKYTYKTVPTRDLETSAYFRVTTAEAVEEILSYVENFEGWVEAVGGELKEHYDLDKTVISEGDYFYIALRDEQGKFDNYTVYYFDVDAQILYYFHNNI